MPTADMDPQSPNHVLALYIGIFWGRRRQHIVSRHRVPDTLERKFAYRSTVTSFSTAIKTRGLIRICPGLPRRKAGCNIGYRPDGGIIKAAFKADSAERGKSVRNANAEANVVPQSTPLLNQRSDSRLISIAISTACRAGSST